MEPWRIQGTDQASWKKDLKFHKQKSTGYRSKKEKKWKNGWKLILEQRIIRPWRFTVDHIRDCSTTSGRHRRSPWKNREHWNEAESREVEGRQNK
ncbi:unnamed protein product [Caenorhabditis nigoni]